MVPAGIASICAGFMLLAASWRFRDAVELRWWATAFLISAGGVAVIVFGLVQDMKPATTIGTASLGLIPILLRAGVDQFARNRVSLPLLLAGPSIWLAAFLLAPASDQHAWSTLVVFSLWLTYVPSAVWVLAREVDSRSWTKNVLMVLFSVHSSLFLGAVYEVLAGALPMYRAPDFGSWFGSILLESILFTVGAPISMIMLSKERADAGHIHAARTDPLTGIANRRALFDDAEHVIAKCARAGLPCSVIMFDLDHFKQINDIHGHRGGDRVLRIFADTVRDILRPDDLFGRYGGEEFLAILPGATLDVAYVIADRARARFAAENRWIDGNVLEVTVSAGVATVSDDPHEMYEAAFTAADRALYSAKHGGRNRVARASHEHAANRDQLPRIA